MTERVCETEKLYENDSYIKEFSAVVTACVPMDGHFLIALDRTAFFPEGGGQGADTGSLDEAAVYDVQIRNGIIYHETDQSFDVGRTVYGRIHWEQRFSNMQQHSGEHIFSGLVHRLYGFNNVGFHLGSGAVTMDFDGMLDETDLKRLEALANRAIFENVGVTVSYPGRDQLETMTYRSKLELEGTVRIVTVEGYDVCACCAPHVARTGEIGCLKIVGTQKYKGGIRISILCGFRALADYGEKQDSVSTISALLSSKPDQVADAVQRLMGENNKIRQELFRTRDALIAAQIEGAPSGRESMLFFYDDMDAASMRRAVNEGVKKFKGYVGAFSGNEDDGYRYIMGSRYRDVQAVAAVFREQLGGKGGGSREMIQGYVRAGQQDIQALINCFGKTSLDSGNE